MQVDPALDAVQRIVGGRFELDARGLFRGEIGKAGHRQAGERHGGEGDYGKILFQSPIRFFKAPGAFIDARQRLEQV